MRSKLMTTALALVLAAPGLALAQQTEPATDPASPGMATTPPPVEGGAAGAGDTTGTMGAGTAQEGGAGVAPEVGAGSSAGGVATTTEPEAATGAVVMEESGWWSGRRSDELVGQTLYGADGEEIGEIDNVVLSAAGGDPAAVVGVGGFLGIGERNVAIPLDQIEVGAEDRLTTSMTKDQISALEAYEEGDQWRPLGEGETLSQGAGNQ